MVKDGAEMTFQVLIPGEGLVFYSAFSEQSALIPVVAAFKINVSYRIKCLKYNYTTVSSDHVI